MKKYIKRIITIYCIISMIFILLNCDPAWKYKLDNKNSLSTRDGFMNEFKNFRLYAKANFFGASINVKIKIIPKKYSIKINPGKIFFKSLHNNKKLKASGIHYTLKKKYKKIIYNTRKKSKKQKLVILHKNEILYMSYNLKGFDFSGSCGFANPNKNNFIMIFDTIQNGKALKLFFKK